jgi:hypothetical protein
MKAHYFDADGKKLKALPSSGLVGVGFFSWHRLQEILRKAGEIRPNELLLSYQVDDRGICFRITERQEKLVP